MSAKSGLYVRTGSVQVACLRPTTPATTVDATGLETDATWKTVSDLSPLQRAGLADPRKTLSGSDDLVLVDHGHGHARDAGVLQRLGRDPVELANGVIDLGSIPLRRYRELETGAGSSPPADDDPPLGAVLDERPAPVSDAAGAGMWHADNANRNRFSRPPTTAGAARTGIPFAQVG